MTADPYKLSDTTRFVPKRVAIVYHFFAHYRKAVLDQLCHHSGHHVTLVGDVKGIDGIKEMKVREAYNFLYAPCTYVGYNVLWQRGLLRLALRKDLDVIIYLGNAAWPATWLSALLARLQGKQLLFWTHGYTKRDRGLKRLLRRAFYKIPHGLLFYGNYGREIAIEEGIRADRIYVIYNSLDYTAQKRVRESITPEMLRAKKQELFGCAQTPVVICTARVVPVRRLDLLIRAASTLRQRGVNVNVLVVGDGPDRPRLEKMAAEMGTTVKFYGSCYDEAVLGLLFMIADVTVVPGMVGLTAIHSMAFGTPVIVRDKPLGQSPEHEIIIPGKTGAHFRHGDYGSLADVLEQWLRMSDRKSTRQACIKVIERFYNPQAQVVRIERAISGKPPHYYEWAEFCESL